MLFESISRGLAGMAHVARNALRAMHKDETGPEPVKLHFKPAPEKEESAATPVSPEALNGDEELLDLGADHPLATRRKGGTMRVQLVYAGRRKPIPRDADAHYE